MTMMTTAMMMMKTLTGYCQCSKVCGSPLTYAGEGSHVVADPDDEHYDDCDEVEDNDDDNDDEDDNYDDDDGDDDDDDYDDDGIVQ